MATKQPKNDRALRFYNEVLGLDHLHYGIWEADDEVTLANLRKAQQRYEDLLVDSIPYGVRSILDVGCGTGELSKRLSSADYEVEGLSPDINQKPLYASKTKGRPFHFCRFEDLQPTKKFDCIIMSESGQYIPLDKLFSTAKEALNDGGYLISIDYFVLDGAEGILAKSGHHHDRFLEEAQKHGFTVDRELDITDKIAKTLDFSKRLVEKTILAIEIGTEKFRLKHPWVTKFFGWLFRKKKQKLDDELILLDSEQFSKAKRYKLFVFKRSLS